MPSLAELTRQLVDHLAPVLNDDQKVYAAEYVQKELSSDTKGSTRREWVDVLTKLNAWVWEYSYVSLPRVRATRVVDPTNKGLWQRRAGGKGASAGEPGGWVERVCERFGRDAGEGYRMGGRPAVTSEQGSSITPEISFNL